MLRQAVGSALRQAWKSQTPSVSVWNANTARLFADDHHGSHEDFMPQPVTGPPQSVKRMIEEDLKAHEVMLYMKGFPQQPMCGFSARVVALLNAYGIKFESKNVLDDNELREGIKQYSNWPTIPQLYVDGEFVGGCDVLWEAHEKGEFEDIFRKAPPA